MKDSLFITLEGIDGSGKSVLAKGLHSQLEQRGGRVVCTREPTDSWLGEAVKRCYSEEIDILSETMLFVADRAQHAREIRNWMGRGKIVISDRYHDSTVAYQTVRLASRVPDGEDGAFRRLVSLGELVGLVPDLTILLDISPKTALKRIGTRGEESSRFERLDYLEGVRKNYLRLASENPRIAVIDASLPPDDVLKQARDLILVRL